MKVKDITQIIEDWCPNAYAEEFDNVGLLVGDQNTEVTNILIALDTLEETVNEAIKKQCNLIISFHPIIFSGLKKITGANYVEKVVIKAIQNNIAIYAMHTTLDNSIEGVSAKMAEIIGLKQTKILIPQQKTIKKLTTYVPLKNAELLRAKLFEAGGGSIGNYDQCSFNTEGIGTYRGNEDSHPTIGTKGQMHHEKEVCIGLIFEKHKQNNILKALFKNHPYEEVAYEITTLDNLNQQIGMGMIGELSQPTDSLTFFNHLKETFNLSVIRHSNICKKTISRVAVLGGSGSFAINHAIKAQADVYITADLKYHDFYKAENSIILADIGHYESEQFTKNLILDYLTKKIINFAPALFTGQIILSDLNTNPINYL